MPPDEREPGREDGEEDEEEDDGVQREGHVGWGELDAEGVEGMERCDHGLSCDFFGGGHAEWERGCAGESPSGLGGEGWLGGVG